MQRWLDTSKLDTAVAALDAMQEQAERAEYQTLVMLRYQFSLQTTLSDWYTRVSEEADQLSFRANEFVPAQKVMADSLRWAVGESRVQLDHIREGWASRLQACLVGEEKRLQV